MSEVSVVIPTGFQARVEADSVSPAGDRIVTLVLTYPRIIHSEFMTYRSLSRNAGSSRAIPVEKTIEAVKSDPFVPVWWGKNQPGMQAREELSRTLLEAARAEWVLARDRAVKSAQELLRLGVHKQILNRVLEAWSWITVVATGNVESWEHLFEERCHPDAQPEFQKIATMARDVLRASTPEPLAYGDWHLPFAREKDYAHSPAIRAEDLKRICAARCARVSYLTHDGKRDTEKDVELYEKLVRQVPGHWSPLEHVATPVEFPSWDTGERNLKGWRTLRQEVEPRR